MLQNVVAAEELTLVKEKQKPMIVLQDVRIKSSNLNCVLQFFTLAYQINK